MQLNHLNLFFLDILQVLSFKILEFSAKPQLNQVDLFSCISHVFHIYIYQKTLLCLRNRSAPAVNC